MKRLRVFALFLSLFLVGCTGGQDVPEPSRELLTTESVTQAASLPILASDLGHAESEQSKYIFFWLDWSVQTRDFQNAEVTVTVGVKCHSIDIKPRPGMGVICINGQTLSFSSPALKATDENLHNYVFTTKTFTVPMEAGFVTLDLAATWPFNGTYHGVNLTDLTVSASVSFPNS